MMTVARQTPDAWRHLKWIRSSVDLRHYVKEHLPNISCNAHRIWKDDKSTGELGVQSLLADAIDREESKGENAEAATTGATTKKRKPVTVSEQSEQQFTRPKKVVRFHHQVTVYQPQPQPVQIFTCSVCRVRSFSSYDEACAHQMRCHSRMYYRTR